MRYSLLTVHLSLLGAVVALVISLDLAFAATGAGLLIAAGPLALAVRGLYRNSRYTQQWLSIAMVFYVGLALVETIASQARSPSATIVLLASGIELSLLFITLRRARRASRESTGS
ncbi:MAG: DUF2069 domain-containing protein [Gammaproteobacteria bacterium]|nr:DUF2069 domain-containing protein [Gammaproteobacteria bacterium]